MRTASVVGAIALGAAALLAAVGYVLFELPDDLVSAEDLKRGRLLELRNDVRTTGVQVVGGLVLAVGTIATAWNALRAWRVSQEGQITERFTRAVEQLASDKPDIRLGGIYALDRVARDSPRDHAPVMHVLASFLREYAGSSGPRPSGGGERAADILAVLTVLGGRDAKRDRGMRLDLSGIDVELADLVRADLRGANLAEANLRGAFLDKAKLDHANLTGAILANARMGSASLRHANLTGANLDHAQLASADLRHARLSDASLRGANLTGARGAALDDAICDDRTRLP